MVKLQEDYGDVVQLCILGRSLYFIFEPAIVNEILTKNPPKPENGIYKQFENLTPAGIFSIHDVRRWRPYRKSFSHVFSYRNIVNQSPKIHSNLLTLCKILDDSKSNELDIDKLLMNLTFDVIGNVCMNYDFETLTNNQHGIDVMTLFHKVVDDLVNVGRLTTPSKFLSEFGLFPWVNRHMEQRKILVDLVDSLVKKSRKNLENKVPEAGRTILEVLIESKNSETNEYLNDREIVDNVIIFLFAGHDTTAHTVATTLYELAKNQSILKKVQEEVDKFMVDKIPNEKELKELKFLNAVWKEGLRLHAAGAGSIRTCEEDTTYGNYFFEKGASLLCLNFVGHRDKRYWKNPFEFNPERWLGEESNNPAGVYYPFSLGPRDCIGKAFADFEALTILATIIKGYDFVLKPGFVIKQVAKLTFHPDGGIQMKFSKRN